MRWNPLTLALGLCLALCTGADAQPYRGEDAQALATDSRCMYVVDLADTRSQLIRVSMVLSGIDSEAFELKLPVWRPGRYEILDPAGTVRTLAALSEAGEPVAFEKTDKATWRFQTDGVETLVVDYVIYANSINNRTRHADHSHAFISPSSVLMYNPDRRGEPSVVNVTNMPDGWRVSTGLSPHPRDREGSVFVARDYDTLVDSPLEIGLQDVKSFEVRGVPHEIVIWGEHEADMDRLAEDFAKIVEDQARIFEEDGPLPYGRYVFQIHCGPGLGGGTEHLNSTIMQTRPASFTDDDRYEGFLGLVSHEMFHTWNVKRLRPSGITPYEYQRENYTDLLWVAEGTTSYYDDLTLVRTGLIGIDTYLSRLRGSIGSVRAAPGLHVQSLENSSFDAWIKFNQRTPDTPNVTVNFYSQGAMASLLIDSWIRQHTADERSLDNAMRELYRAYPLDEGGFTTDDLIRAVAEAAERPETEARAMLTALAGGTGDLPLEQALDRVGLALTRDDDNEGSDLGLRLTERDGFAAVRTVYEGRPAFDAGLQADDLIVAFEGRRATPDSVTEALERLAPGTPVTLTLLRRDTLMQIELESGPPTASWSLERIEEPTQSQRSAFQAWLGQPFVED